MTAFEKVKYGAFFPSEGKKISQKEEGKNMAVKWTAEQQKVIDARDRNLLVSAAAGSGKTAVLVERILAMVKDLRKTRNMSIYSGSRPCFTMRRSAQFTVSVPM